MTSHERPRWRSASPDPAVSVPAVSVIVPVHDGAGLIEQCLRALDAQTLGPGRYEVIVVDDGSTDGTAVVARAFAEGARVPVRVIAQPQNRGPAAARNAGLAATRAPAVAFTDADCEPALDWLETGLARLDSEAGLAGVEGRTDPAGEPTALTHQMRNVTGGQWMTCNMLYRREAIARAGGFDERFRMAYLEDTDLAFGVKESGGEIAWEPAMVVNHLVLSEGRRKFWRDARKHFYNVLVYRKHPRMYLDHLRPVRPGFPGLYVRYMAAAAWIMAAAALGFANAAIWLAIAPAAPVLLLHLRRIAYVHRARDPISFAQAALVPFVQTFWVLAGAVRFRAFSTRL